MLPAEALLLHAVLDDPDDVPCRCVYADWLQEHGDSRGDYLRHLLRLRALPKDDPQVAGLKRLLGDIRPGLDRHWVALLDVFDARVREVRTIRLRIGTHGTAPKRYNGAAKVGPVACALLVGNGWEHAGDGQRYSYVRPPAGMKARDPVIPVEVPTDAEIGRMASALHARGKSVIRVFGPWFVRYQRAHDVRGPAEFEFGVGAPWSVTLSWKEGSDTPAWARRDSQEVGQPE